MYSILGLVLSLIITTSVNLSPMDLPTTEEDNTEPSITNITTLKDSIYIAMNHIHNNRREMKHYKNLVTKGQRPHFIFIACSDSRVVPSVFTASRPGNLFMVRNIGNLVPVPSQKDLGCGVAAALHYAQHIGVTDIAVCGHSDCGAMKAICADKEYKKEMTEEMPEVMRWVGTSAVDVAPNTKVAKKCTKSGNLDPDCVSKENVRKQIINIEQYRFVQDKMNVHGFWFDIAKGDVYYLDSKSDEFINITKPSVE